ncbi:uncharacterized protein LOC126734908 [Anthonomus grandis grandis]|uniref:uncharacterized protein LOC126734908 n=1 Tax=Anthonomus grandis grandis TaxID=2921223 RepID=UPI00216548BA|nr:uncharacterized protein LOC126734908 [Anthonomus grandis grandis]
MNPQVFCLFFTYLAVANAGLIPTAQYLEGPSTRTKVIGPDGSIIDAYAPGGKILLEEGAGAAPAVPEHSNWLLHETSELLEPNSVDSKVLLHPGIAPRAETRESVPITEETDESTTESMSTTTEYPTEDLSGTYVPDTFEELFDDGSYRPEHY